MLLRYPYFTNDIGGDQPWHSMKLIAPYCDFLCAGCQNRHLGQAELKDFSPESLKGIYESLAPFVEGVTIGGLEVNFCDFGWLQDLLSFINGAKSPKLLIYTRQSDWSELSESLQYTLEALSELPTLEFLAVKYGRYLADRPKRIETFIPEADATPWSLSLASDNQFLKIYKSPCPGTHITKLPWQSH